MIAQNATWATSRHHSRQTTSFTQAILLLRKSGGEAAVVVDLSTLRLPRGEAARALAAARTALADVAAAGCVELEGRDAAVTLPFTVWADGPADEEEAEIDDDDDDAPYLSAPIWQQRPVVRGASGSGAVKGGERASGRRDSRTDNPSFPSGPGVRRPTGRGAGAVKRGGGAVAGSRENDGLMCIVLLMLQNASFLHYTRPLSTRLPRRRPLRPRRARQPGPRQPVSRIHLHQPSRSPTRSWPRAHAAAARRPPPRAPPPWRRRG